MKTEPLERSFTIKFLHCLGSSSFAHEAVSWSPFIKHIPYAFTHAINISKCLL